MKNNLRIGWYCPYTLPPIAQIKNITEVEILWNEGKNSFFGNVKLCRKMTALLETVESKEINGLIMPECCNVAYSIKEYLKREYTDLSLYSIYIPRKVDESFNETLWNQWNILYDKLDGNQQVENSKLNTNPFTCNIKEIATRIDDLPMINPKNNWCSMPKDYQINDKSLKQIAGDILETVNCPRLIFKNNKRHSKFNDVPVPDQQCIIQRYYTCLSQQPIMNGNGDEADESTST
ncbi:hypothetical protein [Alkaliphilus peptidifermentans]|uniref:Uncharacterized protein n=1 Tax=Alkaliphilus peptidifermentans DSM 18978 TaxID=1120976 RepID=A0A1G5I4A5_9FIRM|nr:hypothetical protein [Alkaliphilus peptidifermentans]SCY70499.1 hypothetical protein SAMN03080606_02234 [Alkaliphilus peptidifermentans DSM 18978]